MKQRKKAKDKNKNEKERRKMSQIFNCEELSSDPVSLDAVDFVCFHCFLGTACFSHSFFSFVDL